MVNRPICVSISNFSPVPAGILRKNGTGKKKEKSGEFAYEKHRISAKNWFRFLVFQEGVE
jgi:hypothetical protein